MSKKVYVIRTLRMVEYLASLKIPMLRIATDKKNPKYNVYLYEDNEILRDALDKKEKYQS